MTEEQRLMVANHVSIARVEALKLAGRAPGSVDVEDLLQEGILGLIQASRTWDPDRGIRFASYAEHRARGAIQDYLRGVDFVGRSSRVKGRKIQNAISSLSESLGRYPTMGEVARELGVTRKKLESELPGLTATIVPIPEDLAVAEECQQQGPPEHPESARLLRSMKMSPAERRVVYAYYYEGRMMREIARLEGVSESRICQVHQAWLDRFSRRLLDFLNRERQEPFQL
jgi:RNA polymerase sigma factor for flagellar operon FliA